MKTRRKVIEKRYNNLNEKQKEAVFNTEGPLLVLAGAGSGKTTVIVHKISYLIEYGGGYYSDYIPENISGEECEILDWYANGDIDEIPHELERLLKVNPVSPYNILAITFTNKAAAELKSRLESQLGACGNDIWASTFHSACVKFLRRDIDKIGYERNFAIFDMSDQQTVAKECLKELKIDDKQYTPKAALNAISSAKDKLIAPDEYLEIYNNDMYFGTIAKIYRLYQKKLKSYNALDFDDLIFNTVRLFEEFPEVLEYYQNKFKYILVDEYQDTNHAQYKLISLLAKKNKNLCVVGDDDQSIYKFRGADIQNILGFEQEFKQTNVIKLEENYRSTQNILNAANEVISNNIGRKGKKLWTSNGDGEKLTLFAADNEHDEAYFISGRIKELNLHGDSFNDFAILYRTNAQSRVIEDSLLKSAVPYRVLGGLRFYDRKEIKDLTAYLRLIQNSNDNVALRRIINEPKRSIGNTSVDKLESYAEQNGVSIFEICSNLEKYDVNTRANNKIKDFVEMINSLTEDKNSDIGLEQFVKNVLARTRMISALETEKTIENQTRIENLNEFISMVQETVRNNPETTLEEMLENISLVSDIDNYDEAQETVVLMTLHSAKGLEFPNVFLVGLEEGVFPGMRSFNSQEELEEERRLCYVGITRAKKRLFISWAKLRTLYGSTKYSTVSRFVKEIPCDLISEFNAPKKTIKDFNVNVRKTPIFEPASFITKTSSNRNREVEGDIERFNSSDRVHHRKFGDGVVISAQEIGNDMLLKVKFDSGEEKNLMAAYLKGCLYKI